MRRFINLYYRCRAVQTIDIGGRGDRFYTWTVTLFPDNHPAWFEALNAQLVNFFLRSAREEAGLMAAPNVLLIS